MSRTLLSRQDQVSRLFSPPVLPAWRGQSGQEPAAISVNMVFVRFFMGIFLWVIFLSLSNSNRSAKAQTLTRNNRKLLDSSYLLAIPNFGDSFFLCRYS